MPHRSAMTCAAENEVMCMQIKFYSTLTADFFPTDPTDLGSSYKESEGIPYTGEELTGYRDIIQKAVQDDVGSFNGDLMQYYHEDDSLRSKVISAIPGVDEVNGELVGSLCVDTNAELTAEEQAKLCDYISGQYSDGWGEGFEQREVNVGDGNLCVHFWQPTGFELKRDVPEAEKTPSRPKMQLAGQDGNIFSIMGHASRLLSDSGQADRAKEMRGRVMDCLSYEAALKVVSEYVKTELSSTMPTKEPVKRGRDNVR